MADRESDELYDLLSAFDEVSASDDLKDATLARIAALSATSAEQQGAPSAPSTPPGTFKASAGGKAPASPLRSRWRAVRVAAVAACLAFALTGGVAYAVPASHVDVTQGGATVTLGINCFGMTVSVESSDDAGKELIEGVDLFNVSRDEAIDRMVDSMGQLHPEEPVEVDGQLRRAPASESAGGAVGVDGAGASPDAEQPQGPDGGAARDDRGSAGAQPGDPASNQPTGNGAGNEAGGDGGAGPDVAPNGAGEDADAAQPAPQGAGQAPGGGTQGDNNPSRGVNFAQDGPERR